MSPTEPAATVLVVEDDEPTRTFLADNLTADGYELLVAGGLRDALRALEQKFPDLAIVDLGLPDGSGLELVERVRRSDGVASRMDPALPLLVVSGRGGELDRLRGFERGCDDYVAKPFSYPELRLRVQALLRRAELRRRPSRVRVGDLELDAAARTVRVRGEPVELSQKEFALARMLASDPTRVFSKEELLRTIWGFRSLGTTRTLDSHACRLRNKLGRHGDRFVVNVWGVGYRLVDGPVAEAPLSPAAAAALVPLPLPLLAASGWASAVAGALCACALLFECRRRRELVVRACHELRGPLTAARLALTAPGGEAAVERELARAGAALEDLAAAPRGRRRSERPEAVDVGELVAAQASAWRVAVAEGAARTVVRGDRVRLTQALGNLVANAIEHGAAPVELGTRRIGDRVRIEVADHGPGLPAPVADLTRRARGGRGRRGRGLAIAAEIAHRHGGRLVAAPTARGARMALELPASHGR
jgi:DNA-binding response OmpR family regulator